MAPPWGTIPQQDIACSAACHQEPEGGELKAKYQGHEGCVNCHSSSDSATTYDLELGAQHSITVPVVYYTGTQEPTTYLAGGNFYSVAGGGAENDPKGHNVVLTAIQRNDSSRDLLSILANIICQHKVPLLLMGWQNDGNHKGH